MFELELLLQIPKKEPTIYFEKRNNTYLSRASFGGDLMLICLQCLQLA